MQHHIAKCHKVRVYSVVSIVYWQSSRILRRLIMCGFCWTNEIEIGSNVTRKSYGYVYVTWKYSRSSSIIIVFFKETALVYQKRQLSLQTVMGFVHKVTQADNKETIKATRKGEVTKEKSWEHDKVKCFLYLWIQISTDTFAWQSRFYLGQVTLKNIYSSQVKHNQN